MVADRDVSGPDDPQQTGAVQNEVRGNGPYEPEHEQHEGLLGKAAGLFGRDSDDPKTPQGSGPVQDTHRDVPPEAMERNLGDVSPDMAQGSMGSA